MHFHYVYTGVWLVIRALVVSIRHRTTPQAVVRVASRVGDMETSSQRTPQHHDLRQPLNVISLTMANFRLRIEPKLDEVDAIYLNRKLERVEGELQRLAKMLDAVEMRGQATSNSAAA